MSREFQGRAVIPGRVEGEAVVTRAGFNGLASLLKSLIMRSRKAVCSDRNNPELYGKVLTGRILCLPRTHGSTVGGLALETAIDAGVAPRALLFAEQIDSIAASGVILADVWLDKRIVTVDRLGPEFLDCVQDGLKIEIREDGTVVVEAP